jgi:hypothetical protein
MQTGGRTARRVDINRRIFATSRRKARYNYMLGWMDSGANLYVVAKRETAAVENRNQSFGPQPVTILGYPVIQMS